MGETGACTAVAYKFLDWFGKKHIITVLSLFCFLLCYGGVSFFVCMFAVGPIMFKLFEELNIPRKLTIIPIAIGGASWSMAVPGSTQVQNVIPTGLGTTLGCCLSSVSSWPLPDLQSVLSIQSTFIKKKALVAADKEEGWDKNWKSPVKGELKFQR